MHALKITIACCLLLPSYVAAQHSDVRFSYEDQVIVFREGVEAFNDGSLIFEGTFPTSGFSIRFTENPGFLAETENGDMIAPGDDIEIEILQSQTFGTFLTFYDPMVGEMAETAADITINDNGGTDTVDFVIGDLDFSGDNPQFIQTGDGDGELHSHIDFELSVEAEFGAYGFLIRLLSSNPAIEPSDPVWMVFNFGMSPTAFEQEAIPAFAAKAGFILGDVNGDGVVNLLDVGPFVDLLSTGGFSAAADINGDGAVNLLDVGLFVDLLSGG